jgi:transcription elongation factor Elf1
LIAEVGRPYDPILSPNTGQPLPITCPKCGHEGCVVIVRSLTIMTCACANCRHTWATDMAVLPEDVQQRIPKVLNDH